MREPGPAVTHPRYSFSSRNARAARASEDEGQVSDVRLNVQFVWAEVGHRRVKTTYALSSSCPADSARIAWDTARKRSMGAPMVARTI